MRTEPLAPGATGTSMNRFSGPIGSFTRVPSRVPVTKSAASSLSHAVREASTPSSPPNQRASAGRPSRVNSASGSAGTAEPARRPINPASAASGPFGMAPACARTRPSTRSSAAACSEGRSATESRRSRGVAAPGICKALSASEKLGGKPPAPVGTSTLSDTPPRCATPGTGAAASSVMSTASVARAAAVPSSSGEATVCPVLAAEKSGMCAETDAAGEVDDARTPRPMATDAVARSSMTRKNATVGFVALAIGSQVAPSGPTVRSSPPKTSSTKATSASRCCLSASMRER